MIDHEQWAIRNLDLPIEDIQHALLRPEFSFKKVVEFFGPPHLHRFRGHDRPREDGKYHQGDDDDFALKSGVLENKQRICFGYQKIDRNVHRAVLTDSALSPS